MTHEEVVQNPRRRGQTLAEFAITLPTLLLLMFGIVEFGRIFQAWVSLQNAARTAARYASTYQYDTTLYTMNLELNAVNPSDPSGFIPCVDDGPESFRTYTADGRPAAADRRGSKQTIYPNGATKPSVEIYTGDLESAYATFHDGDNCDPRDPADQDRRRDMARILSIYAEARRGAAGLAIEATPWNVGVSKTDVAANWSQLPWFQIWQNDPQPTRALERGFFNVTLCSDRQFEYPGQPGVRRNFYNLGSDPVQLRFMTYTGVENLNNAATNTAVTAWAPQCLLNEMPSPMPAGGLNNAGRAWIDAGGPEDTVYVIVTFNHPLVTPLGLAPYLTMQARRSAIVESFRSTRVRTGVISAPPIGVLPPGVGTSPTATPIPTWTPRPTATETSLPTVETPAPLFECSNLSVTNLRLFGTQVLVNIGNTNADATYIRRVQLTWPTIAQVAQTAVTDLSLDGREHWIGNDRQNTAASDNTTDTDTDPSTPAFNTFPIADRTVAGGTTGVWAATFTGPASLSQYVASNRFGVVFTLHNPRVPDSPCSVTISNVMPTATATLAGNPATPTPTFTPDCINQTLRIRFSGFETFGLARFEVLNERTIESTMIGFDIRWVKRFTSQSLRRVTAGAPFGAPGSVLVWESSSATEDANSPTVPSEGTWRSNYSFPPGAPRSPSSTYVYLDFDGTAGRLDDNGVAPHHFNGTQFNIVCGTPTGGGGGGAGGLPTGIIIVQEFPTPTNTFTPAPTSTPGPTDTARPPSTQAPPPTAGPPPTSQPTSVPPPTAVPPQPTQPGLPPTQPPSGGGDGS